MTHGNAFRNHAAKRDVHRVRVGRRYWHFTFSDMWGPLLTDEWGDPVNNMPLADEAHPFWDAFEAWQAEDGREVGR
jgi:hypothetical protein